MGSVLVVAFDGLDKELMAQFSLDEIVQKEFGSIDNTTGINEVKTAELFASFITGKNYEEHGIQKLNYYPHWFLELMDSDLAKGHIPGYFTFMKILEEIFKSPKIDFRKEHLKCPSLFEKIDLSRAMFVPSYNPSIFNLIGGATQPLRHGAGPDKTAEFIDTREYRYRKEALFRELDLTCRDFTMCHFHRPDFHQHLYGDESIEFNREKLRKLYYETDELAENIVSEANEAGYDYIIFMSDHGLPTEKAHNENAFYSCNKELFPNKTPHITDFHDRILELVNQ